jgi:polysaccharide export outer membrane protein
MFQDEAIEQSEYRIAASDELAVRVWKNPELSVEGPVLPDGTFSVPLAGSVSAEGLTTDELEDLVAGKLDEYIAAPEVSVTVMKVNSKRVSVLGEVVRSGPQNVSVDTRVVDAIAMAGGFTPYANRGKVKVIRRNGGDEVEFRFDYDAFEAGRAPGTNVRLQPGDTVLVSD